MKIRTQLITGFSVLAVVVVVMEIAVMHSLSLMNASEDWLAHTYQVIGRAQRVEVLMLDMETGERGFLLTGDEAFLEPYQRANNQYAGAVTALKTRVADNPTQVQRLIEIESFIARWQETVAEPIIEKRRQINTEAASSQSAGAVTASRKEIEAFVGSGIGKNFMDQMRNKTEAFIALEEDLLDERHGRAEQAEEQNRITMTAGLILFIIVSTASLMTVTRSILRQVGGEPAAIAAITNRIAEGDLEVGAPTGKETGILASVHVMLASLKNNRRKISNQNWLTAGITGLYDTIRGTKAMDVLCEDIIAYVARYLDVQVGTLSLADKDRTRLVLTASYAYTGRPDGATEFRFGEGLIGQAAQEKKRILMKQVPENSFTITSALGEIRPASIVCLPLVYEEDVIGVIELGALQAFPDIQLAFLDQIAERIAIAINAAHARERMKVLLEESQAQAEELEAQQEELRVNNEELEEKNAELETRHEESGQEPTG